MDHLFKYKEGIVGYSDEGRGETIVLLHGYLETSKIWSSFAKRLAERFRIIAIDLPGHGRSGIFSENHSMEFMADVVNELILSIGIKKFFLTGHSLGGYVALACAELFPERLSGYCLFHSHPFADSPEAIEKRKREINLVKGGKKDLLYNENIAKMFATPNLEKFPAELQRSVEIASAIPGEGIIAVLKGMMARPSRQSVIEAGRIPCLWILGTMDNYINYEQVQARIKVPANARVVLLRNSGHLGFIEEEQLAVKAISDFINKLSATA
jgi:pimeloyl-ACP methyl ester carboxylesterase